MRRILATVTVATLATVAATLLTSAVADETTAVQATAAGEAPLDRYRSQCLEWTPCDADTPGLECATLRAPRDWHHPGSGTDITLAISRLPADPATRTGILLLDGGPASNLDLPLDFEDKPIAAGSAAAAPSPA